MIADILAHEQRDQLQLALLDVNLALESLFLVVQGLLARPAEPAGENAQPIIQAIQLVGPIPGFVTPGPGLRDHCHKLMFL